MLAALIDWSLRHRFHAVAGPLGLAVLGLFPLDSLNIDAFPDTAPVRVQINTIAPGLAPREVESQITAPVEQGIGGLPALRQVRSVSEIALSRVVATFADVHEDIGSPVPEFHGDRPRRPQASRHRVTEHCDPSRRPSPSGRS